MRFLSVLRRGKYVVAPPLGDTTRHFTGRVLPPPKDKILSTVKKNWDVSLGVLFTVTLNFFYVMDFDGRWKRMEAENNLHSEKLEQRLRDAKRRRERVEVQLERVSAGRK